MRSRGNRQRARVGDDRTPSSEANRGFGRVGLTLWLAAVIAMVGIATPGRTPAVSAATTGVVATDALQVRAEPGTWAEVIGVLPGGEWVEIWRGPTGDNWYQIAYAGGGGWVHGDFLSLDGAGAVAAGGGPSWSSGVGGAGGANAWVDTDALNVRAGASTDAAVYDRVAYGDGVSVLGGEVNGFVPVAYARGQGWVWAGYLRWDGPPTGGTASRSPAPERWIDVDRSAQRVTLFVGNEPVASFWGAMGFDDSNDGFYATANGTYAVYALNAELTWTPWAKAYIEDWVAFDPARQNGFHSYLMDARGNVLPEGADPTGGCVAVDPWGSQQIFDFAEVGMRVEVHW